MSTARLAIWAMLGLMMGGMMGVAGGTGALRFEDRNSGSTVRLQSSEVKKISSEEFDAAVKAPTGATGEAPGQK